MTTNKLKLPLLFMIIVFLLPFFSVAQSSFTKMIWADEFNIQGLPDSNKWSYDTGRGCPDNCGWGNNELQYYTDKRSKNARVENGVLIIESHHENYQNAKYTSARLASKNKGDWKYGRFEIKAKLPAGRGMWPAIWMLPTNWEYGNWPHSGEIDIMENVGYWPDSLLSTVHTGAYNGSIGTQKTSGINVADLSTAFHVYAAEWNTEGIAFFIDDKQYNYFRNEQTNRETWPFDKAFHLMLNIAVGGNWGGKFGVDDAIFPQKMEVDYVRVFE